MAANTLMADSARVTLIADCKRHADELESIIAEVGAVLLAIGDGDLLARLPEGEEDKRRHSTATWLLTLAENRLASANGLGDDLSAKLCRLESCQQRDSA